MTVMTCSTTRMTTCLDLDADIAELEDDEFNPADLDLDADIAEPGDEEDSERTESDEDRNVVGYEHQDL